MAIYHLNVRGISPARGSSAVMSAAYQSGQALDRDRTGETISYGRAERVAAVGIELPAAAPEWANDRERLWNEAEAAHAGGVALVARRYEVALPDELSLAENKALVEEFARTFTAQGYAVDWAIHVGADGRNTHAHLLKSAQTLGPDGFVQEKAKSTKAYLLRDENGNERHAVAAEWKALKAEGWQKVFNYRLSDGGSAQLTKDEAAKKGLGNSDRKSASPVARCVSLDGSDGRELEKLELLAVRKTWADLANSHLERAGRDERIDHRSYEAQGVSLVPTLHLGPKPSAERVDENERIKKANALIEQALSRAREAAQQLAQAVERAAAQARAWWVTRTARDAERRKAAAMRQHRRNVEIARSSVKEDALEESLDQSIERARETARNTISLAPEREAPSRSYEPER